jgi:hypothetical protein
MTEADIQTKRRQPPPSSHGREPVRAKRPAPPFLRLKPRGEWTLERVKLLATMWGRGDRTVDIAAALKCSPEAVSVARAYFRLAPPRLLPGRPKVIDDEPRHKIERVAFITSRLAEFCTKDELAKQTDSEWSLVVFKDFNSPRMTLRLSSAVKCRRAKLTERTNERVSTAVFEAPLASIVFDFDTFRLQFLDRALAGMAVEDGLTLAAAHFNFDWHQAGTSRFDVGLERLVIRLRHRRDEILIFRFLFHF